MRQSDRIKHQKNTIEKLHDKQIFDSVHDAIVLWLYEALKKNVYSSEHHIWMKIADGINYKPEYHAYIEHPIFRHGWSQPIGFADLAVHYYDSDDNQWKWRYIEVKSRLNIGETIRQIKYYGGTSGWLVCAPECSDSQILIEQGIGFIKYEPGLWFEGDDPDGEAMIANSLQGEL